MFCCNKRPTAIGKTCLKQSSFKSGPSGVWPFRVLCINKNIYILPSALIQMFAYPFRDYSLWCKKNILQQIFFFCSISWIIIVIRLKRQKSTYFHSPGEPGPSGHLQQDEHLHGGDREGGHQRGQGEPGCGQGFQVGYCCVYKISRDDHHIRL